MSTKSDPSKHAHSKPDEKATKVEPTTVVDPHTTVETPVSEPVKVAPVIRDNTISAPSSLVGIAIEQPHSHATRRRYFDVVLGRPVHYTVKDGDRVSQVMDALNGRTSGDVHGNVPRIGDVLPAKIVRCGVDGDTLVNLRVTLDCEQPDVWVGSVDYDADGAPGTYREPVRD